MIANRVAFLAWLYVGLGTVVGYCAEQEVPEEFRSTYQSVKHNLDDLSSAVGPRDNSLTSQVTFAAELLPANCNRGTALLRPNTIKATALFMDRFKELGISGVTFPIHYPMYLPSFEHYAEYVAFYKQVMVEARKRNLKVDIEAHVVFANTSFSELPISYDKLTFEQYKRDKKQMISDIIKDLQPDYLNLGAEPDTEFTLTKLKELSDPQKYGEYLKYITTGLDKGKTKLIVGIGTWGNIEYVKGFATNPDIDCLDMHIYPVSRQTTATAMAIIELARKNRKGVVIDEAWLYKTEKNPGTGNQAWSELFKRDTFSFWAPLDQQFLDAVVRLARNNKVEFVSPFWSGCFFSYIDYDKEKGAMQYRAVQAIHTKAESAALLGGTFSATGEFYRKLIGN